MFKLLFKLFLNTFSWESIVTIIGLMSLELFKIRFCFNIKLLYSVIILTMEGSDKPIFPGSNSPLLLLDNLSNIKSDNSNWVLATIISFSFEEEDSKNIFDPTFISTIPFSVLNCSAVFSMAANSLEIRLICESKKLVVDCEI